MEFATRRDMERAIDKFDDYDLNGRRISLKEEKRGGRGGGRSRSRSRSRSKSRSRSRSRYPSSFSIQP